MSTYAISMNCPNATSPSVLWNVLVFDEVDGGAINPEVRGHKLWVPELDTWTLDTLRMVLHELAAYLPAHDSATATIGAKAHRATGRPRKDQTPRPARFSGNVMISVAARGWRAEVHTQRNEAADKDGTYLGRSPGEWTPPMQAVLLDLARKSPFSLETVRVVDCADPRELSLRYPARRDVIKGVESHDYDAPTKVESPKKRIKRLIDDILRGNE
jgi:hypothetical protein